MALLDDLETLLTGVGAVHKGRLLDAPPDAVALLESAGVGPLRGMGEGSASVAAEYPGVQVLVRGATYQSARALAVAALNALDNYGPGTINGARYDAIMAQQRPPYFVGPDQNDRMLFSFNLLVTRGVTT